MEYFNPYDNRPKRPTILTVLPILTFIGSGLSFLTFIFLALAADLLPSVIEMMENSGMPDVSINIYKQMLDIPAWHFLLMAGTYALAVVGAAMMMALNKIGYHIYIISQILLFCVCNLLIGEPFNVGTFGIFCAILFIALYGTAYKHMKKSKPEEREWNENQDKAE